MELSRKKEERNSMRDIISEQLSEEYGVKFNPKLAGGFAAYQLNELMPYLNEIITNSINSTNSYLEYKGMRLLSPDEVIEDICYRGKRTFKWDISKNTLYTIEINLNFNGTPLPPKHLLIPFDEHGYIILSDTKYIIAPVLSDGIISTDYASRSVFLRLLRDKLIVTGPDRILYLDDNATKEPLVLCDLYRFNTKNRASRIGKMQTLLALYLLANTGLFSYLSSKYNIPISDMAMIDYKDLTQDIWDNYHVYHVRHERPIETLNVKEFNNYRDYKARPVLLIAKGNDNYAASGLKHIVLSALYILEVLPHYKDAIIDDPDDGELWMEILSRVIFKNNYDISTSVENAIKHYESIHTYTDPMIIRILKMSGIYVDDFFGLIHYVLDNITELMVNAIARKNDMSIRYMDILYYIAYHIIVEINQITYTLTRECEDGPCEYNRAKSIVNARLSRLTIYKLNNGKQGTNISLSVLDYNGSFRVFKNSLIGELQERAMGVVKSTVNQFPVTARTITAYHLSYGSIYGVPKAAPTALLRPNPTMELDEFNRLKLSPEEKETSDYLNSLLKDRSSTEEEKAISVEMGEEIDIEE